MEQNRAKSFFFRVLCGFFLGISVIAPGVSGSVMAVMMGIYRDLINVISNPFKNFKRNFFYLLPMVLGAGIALVSGVIVLSKLFDEYPTPARILFMGLVAGGLPSMLKQANNKDKNGKSAFKPAYLLGIIGAFALAASVGLLARFNVETASADMSLFYLCLAGAVSGACSMMPGMSVSMVLMLFGVYEGLMNMASSLVKGVFSTGLSQDNIAIGLTILSIGLCFLIGMVLFSKLTKLIFDRYHSFAYFVVFGFMCGTLTAIFPTTNLPANAFDWAACVLMMALGLAISVLFIKLGKKFNAEDNTVPAEK